MGTAEAGSRACLERACARKFSLSVFSSPSSCQLSQINDEEVVDGMGSVGQKLNVLGTALQKCSRPGGPTTGFYRDGCCTTGDSDYGRHVVCSRMTQAFLEFTRSRGNDLSSPAPQYGFPGLRPGDFWCLCASRW